MIKNRRTAIILCGGKGTRLGALSKKIPKTLVKIQNKEILWFIINILKINNFNHFILPIGYKGAKIKEFVEKNFKNDKEIEIFQTGLNSSISSRIFKVKKLIKSNDFLLLNGDAIFNFNIDKMYKDHVKKKIKMTFVAFKFQADFGTISIRNKKITGFQRNFSFDYVGANDKKGLQSYVYSGISLMNKKLLSKNFKNYENFEKKLYPSVIKKYKCDLKIPHGFFVSIDNMKDIHKINSKSSEISKYTTVSKLKKNIKKFKNKND